MPAFSVVAHRLLWSLIFIGFVLTVRGGWREYLAALRSPRVLGIHFISGMLIGCNWLLFIWATLNGRIVESALGYFLSPLFLIAIGALIYKEKINKRQAIAIVIAGLGVALQLPFLHHVPWVAICLALTFSLYGLVRKRSPLGALIGLAVETTYYVIPSVLWLTFAPAGGWQALDFSVPQDSLLLLLSGVVTALPLLWFGFATRHVKFTTIGIIQFLAPSLQFILGVFVYAEPMSAVRWGAFMLIWIALVIYISGFRRSAYGAKLGGK